MTMPAAACFKGVAFVLCLLLTACSLGPATRPSSPKPAAAPSCQDLRRRLLQLQQQISGVKGMARFTIKQGEKRWQTKQALLLAYPRQLRAETLSMFGPGGTRFAIDGQKMQLWLPQKELFYSGSYSPGRLRRLLRLPLSLDQAQSLLLRHLPVPPLAGQCRVMAEKDRWRFVITTDTAKWVYHWTAQQRVTGLEIWEKGDKQLEVFYRNFMDKRSFYPQEISLSWPEQHVQARVQWRTLEINPQFSAQTFQLTPPDGFEPQPFPETW